MASSPRKHSSEQSPELLRSTPVKRQRNETGGAMFVASSNPTAANGVSECFHKVSTSMYVSLAPVYLHNAIEGVKNQHLDPLIMNYFPAANGVVLAHYNLRLYGQQPRAREVKEHADQQPVVAKIMYDSPFAFLWVSVDLLVWKPMAGDVVEGWINLQSPSHIGLLIHDTFNAAIKRDAIPAEWTFVPNQEDEEEEHVENDEAEEDRPTPATAAAAAAAQDSTAADQTSKSAVPESISRVPRSLGYWVDENGKKIDGKLKFTVQHFNVSGRTVSVQGSLLAPGTIREDLTQWSTKKDRKGDRFDEFSLPATIGTEPKKNTHISFDEQEKSTHISFADEDNDKNDDKNADESDSSQYEDAQDDLDVNS